MRAWATLLLIACSGGADDGTLELGYYNAGSYEVLRNRGNCWVIHGIQGGTWTMPALRVDGLGDRVTARCEIETETELLGSVRANMRLLPSPDGRLEHEALPIPVRHAPPNEQAPIDDLYGQEATLACAVEDTDGHGASLELLVVLAEGFNEEWSVDTGD